MSDRRLVVNAAKCRACGEIIESTIGIPEQTCKCGQLTVSGTFKESVRNVSDDQYWNLVIREEPDEALNRNRNTVLTLLAKDNITEIQDIYIESYEGDTVEIMTVKADMSKARRLGLSYTRMDEIEDEIVDLLGITTISFVDLK
ncbi:hypothetical protein ACMXYX_17820 (plasmid) [Neptuniibacter sp. QD72_48]|uniref:DUF7695 domain-containing protein n=1 Tax=Neptuniibacter sp. QD72_48 TaxID=3398214 RepID=UPI0039F4AE65